MTCISNPQSSFSAIVANVNLASSVDGTEVAQLLWQQDHRVATILIKTLAADERRRDVIDVLSL